MRTVRWALSDGFIWLLVLIVWLIPLTGCTPWSPQNEIERADDLGLITNQPPPPPLLISSIPDDYNEAQRNQFVEEWMARSDYLCRQYKDKIIRFSRNTRFATDATSTILSGLATIFTAVGTIHPLTGAATIVSGVGAAAQTDTFAQQSGEVIASAIQTARENQANQIEFSLTYPKDKYNIYRAQRDVIEYHNMCSMETALAQIRASLKATSPDAGKTPPAAQGTQNPGGAAPTEVQSAPSPLLRPPAGAGPIVLTPPPPLAPEKFQAQVRPRPTAPPAVPANYRAFLADPNPRFSLPQLRRAFAALCVRETEISEAEAASTTARIKAFQQARNYRPGQPMPSATGLLTTGEIGILAGFPKCDRGRFQNVFESYYLWGQRAPPEGAKINSGGVIKKINQQIEIAEPERKLAEDGTASLAEVRNRIPDVRKGLAKQLILTDAALSQQLTMDLWNILSGIK